jgi:hypothetical protein
MVVDYEIDFFMNALVFETIAGKWRSCWGFHKPRKQCTPVHPITTRLSRGYPVLVRLGYISCLVCLWLGWKETISVIINVC